MGLGAPHLRLEYRLTGGGAGEVRVGRSRGEGQAYIQGSAGPWVFVASTSEDLNPPPFDLLDQRLLPFDRTVLVRLEFALGRSAWVEGGSPAWPDNAQAVALEKKGEEWKPVPAPAAGAQPAPAPSGSDALTIIGVLEGFSAGGLAEQAEIPSGERAAVGLRARWPKGEVSVVLVEGESGRWYARLGRGGPAVWVDAAAVEEVKQAFAQGR
ncbi:MAG: hypothetical protein K6T75_10700 [Acetobacteraceae bacterium]|nr:hypothetical protein [Acetobacteraceae bacterium]